MAKSFSALVLFFVVMFGAFPAAAAPSPLDQVQQTVDKVLEVLRNKSVPVAEREDRLRTLVYGRFDFALMSQWTLGPYWRKADAQQRQRFIDLYSELLEANYLGKIEAYTNETVRYLGQKVENGRAEVETEVVTSSNNIPLTYRLSRQGDEWKVYDVVIEGVSLVRNYRSTFGEIARKDGIEGLLQQVAKKVEEQKAAASKNGRKG
jgi:phospholipid transport system substrate-binding protein